VTSAGPEPDVVRWEVLPAGAPEDAWTALRGATGWTHTVVAGASTTGNRYRAVLGNLHGAAVSDPALLTLVVVPPVRVAVEPRVGQVAALRGW